MTEAAQARGRRIALLILAVCAVPTIAAWLAYFVWPPTARLNYGELIEGRSAPERVMQSANGKLFRLSDLRGKWLLVQIDSGACERSCMNKLLYIRQARLAQGRAAERIERVWILYDSIDPAPALLTEYPGMHVVRSSKKALSVDFPAARDPADYIYVIDPLGNFVLRFPAAPDARKMTRDLERLLRVSRVG